MAPPPSILCELLWLAGQNLLTPKSGLFPPLPQVSQGHHVVVKFTKFELELELQFETDLEVKFQTKYEPIAEPEVMLGIQA